MGSQWVLGGGGPRTHFFALFEPRGTPGDPQGSQRSPRSPKEASKRQFGIIFAPIFTHVRPMLAPFFRTFRLRFSYVFPQLSLNSCPTTYTAKGNPKRNWPTTYTAKGNPKRSSTGRQLTQQKGYTAQQKTNNQCSLHSPSSRSSGMLATALHTTRHNHASFTYRDQSTKLQPQSNKARHGGGTARRATG